MVESTWRLVFFVDVPIGIALLAVAGAAVAVLVGSLPALPAAQFALDAAARPSQVSSTLAGTCGPTTTRSEERPAHC